MLPIWVKSMGTLERSKAECRKQILEARKLLKAEETALWDTQIKERLISLPQLMRSRTDTVYCYISVRGEAGTGQLVNYFLDQGFRVAVPRVKGKTMDFYYIKALADLEPGGFGIPEPVASCERAMCEKAPVIVPGVAFSRRFERTGYGAGYYDRFFASEPEHEKIGICYDFQLSETLESQEFDVLMDAIITPGRFLHREESLDA